MFLARRFNFFNFVTAISFSKSSVILLITLFTALLCAFFSHKFNMYKFISPTHLKRSKLGSFGSFSNYAF